MTENNAAQAIQEGERNAAADQYFKARAWVMDTNDNRRIFEAGFDRAYDLLSKLRAEGAQAGGLPAYINDDSQPLQYRLGWNNCLSDCRAALSPTPSVVKQSLTATQTGEKGESDAG